VTKSGTTAVVAVPTPRRRRTLLQLRTRMLPLLLRPTLLHQLRPMLLHRQTITTLPKMLRCFTK